MKSDKAKRIADRYNVVLYWDRCVRVWYLYDAERNAAGDSPAQDISAGWLAKMSEARFLELIAEAKGETP